MLIISQGMQRKSTHLIYLIFNDALCVAAATSVPFLFNDLMFCDDSLERVPAVAVEGATQKKSERKKNLSSALPSASLS